MTDRYERCGTYKNIEWSMDQYGIYWRGHITYCINNSLIENYDNMNLFNHFSCTRNSDRINVNHEYETIYNPGTYFNPEKFLNKLRNIIDYINDVKNRYELTKTLLTHIFINDIAVIIEKYLIKN